jgi:hypothetical protein
MWGLLGQTHVPYLVLLHQGEQTNNFAVMCSIWATKQARTCNIFGKVHGELRKVETGT